MYDYFIIYKLEFIVLIAYIPLFIIAKFIVYKSIESTANNLNV